MDGDRLNKSEIEYILEAPFSMLNRREIIVRKLLTKYHDDKEFMKRAISAVAYSFDPHLAERVRAKHPSSYSKEEKEWASVDRILHPEVLLWLIGFYYFLSDNGDAVGMEILCSPLRELHGPQCQGSFHRPCVW